MAATLSPVNGDHLLEWSILDLVNGSISISHLAAKTCKLVELRAQRLQLGFVHVAVHRQEEQQHLREALAEDPLGEAILHDDEGGEGRAGETLTLWNFNFMLRKTRGCHHNLALVVPRTLVWGQHLTSALHTEFLLVQWASDACSCTRWAWT